MKVTIEDAAQNSGVAYDGAITTLNAPTVSAPPTITAPSPLRVGATLSSNPGEWSAPTGAGAISYGYQWESCDGQGNGCQSIAGAEGANYTPSLADAGHTLRLLVRAANNDGSAYALSAASSSVLGPISFGGTPGPGAAGLGNPNGTGASEAAQIRMKDRRAITRSFAQRAMRISGYLVDREGKAIAGANLDVFQQIEGANSSSVIGHVLTRADGSFVAEIPAGPSRAIEIAYQAFPEDASYAARAKISESVGAGVRLWITPRRTSPEGTILLHGLVRGPIPP